MKQTKDRGWFGLANQKSRVRFPLQSSKLSACPVLKHSNTTSQRYIVIWAHNTRKRKIQIYSLFWWKASTTSVTWKRTVVAVRTLATSIRWRVFLWLKYKTFIWNHPVLTVLVFLVRVDDCIHWNVKSWLTLRKLPLLAIICNKKKQRVLVSPNQPFFTYF
jgi:hypothetical protein